MPIVVGTDLSPHSFEAIACGAAIARSRDDKELVVAHVIDADDDADRERLTNEARGAIDAGVAGLGLPAGGPSLRVEIVMGPVVDSLIHLVETEGNLLVVGDTGTGNTPQWQLGSTAERVVSTSPIPVLIARSAAPFAAWSSGQRPMRALVGIDESVTCEAAVALLKRMRAKAPVDIVLGAVYFPDEAARHYGLHATSAVDAHPEVERLLTRDLLKRFGEPIGAGTVVARPIRGLGRVGDHLVELADKENIDVIVVGTHHKKGLGRLGSVSSVVANVAKQSVLCVPPTAHLGRPDVPAIRIAVVATDLSAFGNGAIPYGYALAGPSGEVHLVHVCPTESDDGESHDVQAEQLLALVPAGISTDHTKTHILHGDDTAELIAETAARVGADVICIASHGRSGITRALMGSVADKLLRETRVPVLILRPKMG
jgi:nucleotide-binding universal stress UspA family protein